MSHDEVGSDERRNSLKSTRDETRSTYVGGRKSGIRTMGKERASVKSNGRGADNVTCRKRYILEDRERKREREREKERKKERKKYGNKDKKGGVRERKGGCDGPTGKIPQFIAT